MAKVLILGNFELSFELPEGNRGTESSIRAKERRILRFLKKLAEEEPGAVGTVESLEVESFAHGDKGEPIPDAYYYNKFEPEQDPNKAN
jgi:hypothetical protein